MVTVTNPYLGAAAGAPTQVPNNGFLDPGMGALFRDITAAGQTIAGGDLAAQRADAQAALADLHRAQARKVLDENQAMRTAPGTLAELFLSGGKFNSDSAQLAPGWEQRLAQANQPTDFSMVAKPAQNGSIGSIFANEGRTAQDKMGAAIQEALARGVKINDIAKFFAQGGYLNHVNNGTPDEGMGYLPLMGEMPNKNTALSTARQDAMAKTENDAAMARSTAVAGIQTSAQERIHAADRKAIGDQQIALEELKQRNRIELATHNFELKEDGTVTAKPSQIPNIPPATIRSMDTVLEQRAKDLGYKIDPDARAAMLAEATRRVQDPKLIDSGFKNPVMAMESVLDDLQTGQNLRDLKKTQDTGIWSTIRDWAGKDPTFSVTRIAPTARIGEPTPGAPGAPAAPAAPGAAPAAAAPAVAAPQVGGGKMNQDPVALQKAREAIARGAPRDAVIKRLKDNGIDATGL